ncbi:maleylacetate reductase [Pseudonocardia hierapolitana]|uniref:Maleylacetate reductase n=1 Tax=Pseudonocardia hierapolitana TaxID=1128676 RepID=A0A561T0H9_9PSEU|nr:maleylacetate reductase [Pseudonocardia hierapolitana]TWF80622.1 maleylacetate reductase [Pseudonocardia hierapolitana]
MWDEFVHQSLPMRVVFGAGSSARLGEEVERLGLGRVLVLCTPEQEPLARRLADGLGPRAADVYPHARMHVPVEVASRARQAAAEVGADGCVAAGGGSTIGLGKAIALEHGLPVIAVPTTYAGSEMTPIWGLTENGRKRTGRDPAVLPRSVVYDPELTLTLPVPLSVTSGFNAMAHAVEGLYAPDASPIISLMAREGAQALIEGLPDVAARPTDLAARTRAQYGAWLCGAVLGATTMSLHHKLCHVLGGTFDLPHAEVHTVVLPHVVAFNATAAPVLGAVLGPDPGGALWELATKLGAPRSLAELGMPESGVAEVVRQAVASPYANPRPVTADDLTRLVEAAHRGERPTPSP